MIKEYSFNTFIEYSKAVVEDPSEENLKKFANALKNYENPEKISCKYCKHFSNKIDNGTGMCKNCLYHYLRYSTHNFEKTPLNFELKK